MRNLAAGIIAIATLAAASACGGDSTSNPTAKPPTPASTAAATPASTAAGTPVATHAVSTSAAATPAVTAPPPGASVEVTGIVGGVNLNGNVIEIKRLSGAAVTEIAVTPATVLRKATGGKIAFKDIRTSDRIIASGALNDRRDQLDANEITVQDVVPGAQPGG